MKRLLQGTLLLALATTGTGVHAATFRCLVQIPGGDTAPSRVREMFIEAPRRDAAECQAEEAVRPMKCSRSRATCHEVKDGQRDPPPAPGGRAELANFEPAGTADGRSDTAGRTEQRPLAPMENYVCKPHAPAWGQPGAQEHFFDARSLADLDRMARTRLGPAFGNTTDDCMTVAQRRADGKAQRQRDFDARWQAAQQAPRPPAQTPLVPAPQPQNADNRSAWLDAARANGQAGPCADSHKICQSACGKSPPASSDTALALAACKTACDRERQQCALMAAGNPTDATPGTPAAPAAAPAPNKPNRGQSMANDLADRLRRSLHRP